MKSKTMMTSAMGGVFALTAFTPLATHAFGDGTCGATMMEHELVDTNNDKQVTEEEMMTHMQKMFDNMDTDDSGSVSKLEWLLVGHPEAR
jgi:hypothetical protein